MEYDIADEDTPVLAVDSKKLRERIGEYQKIGTLYYPVKSNSAREVVELVREGGCNFLVSCPYYLEKVHAAGIAGDAVLYDNCAAGGDEIAEALGKGVRLFTTDSEELFELIHRSNREARFILKVSSGGVSGKKEKFGLGDFSPLKKKIEDAGLLGGLGFYIADSVFSFDALKKQLAFMAASVTHTPILNLGGSLKGLPEDGGMRRLLGEYRAAGFFDEIYLEPGRGLLNPCIEMRTRVTRRRVLNGERRVHIDGGIYSGLMDVYIEHKDLNIRAPGGVHDTPFYVYGNTSDSADFLGTHMLPGDIKEGDVITIADCGAYSWDITCVYSGARPLGIRVI
jgi:diaminopimelate decarboxylase